MTTPELAQEDKNGDRIYRNPHKPELLFRSVTSIVGLLPNDYGQIPPNILQTASERGTWVHGLFEDGTTCSDTIPPLSIPKAQAYKDNACQFMRTWQPQFLHQEMTVFNERLGYAGSLDLIGRLHPTMGVTLADIKASSKVRHEVQLQLAAYGMAEYALVKDKDDNWQTIDMPTVDSYAVIHIKPECDPLIPVMVDDWTRQTFTELAQMRQRIDAISDATENSRAIGLPMPVPEQNVFTKRREALLARINNLQPDAIEALKADMTDKGLNLKTATAHSQLDTIGERITKVDRRYGNVPDDWMQEGFVDFSNGFEVLPADLRMEVVAMSKAYGVPSMRSQFLREHHIDYAFGQLKGATDRWRDRTGQLDRAAAEFLPGDNIRDQMVAIAIHVTRPRNRMPAEEAGEFDDRSTNDIHQLQEMEAEQAISIMEAIDAGLCQVLDGEVVTVSSALSTLVKTKGSKKAVLVAGKQAADVMRIDRPKSSNDVAENPLLAAAVSANLKEAS